MEYNYKKQEKFLRAVIRRREEGINALKMSFCYFVPKRDLTQRVPWNEGKAKEFIKNISGKDFTEPEKYLQWWRNVYHNYGIE